MFWLGIAVSILVFLHSSYRYCTKNKLDFKQFFFFLPWAFLIIYIVWKAVGYYLESKELFGMGNIIKFVLTPNGSDFHYVGIIIGSILALLIFLRNKKKNTIKSIIDMLFFSTMKMCFVLWLFLTLSDSVIGLPNDHGWFAIRALVPYSQIQAYGQVYPYGLIISFIAAISYLLTKYLNTLLHRTGIGYIGFALFFFLMMFGFSYQLYPKHGVMGFWGLSFDVKHYVNIILIIVCSLEYHNITKATRRK
jgi:hypothetical protein